MPLDFLESAPIGLICLGVALAMLACCEIGYQFGERARSRQDREVHASLGPIVAGLLGMLAFVLAFTFSMAAGQYDTRKMNVLDEANVVGTAYLRADLVDPVYGVPLKGLLREYVEVRLQAVRGTEIDAALTRSVRIHGLLWHR